MEIDSVDINTTTTAFKQTCTTDKRKVFTQTFDFPDDYREDDEPDQTSDSNQNNKEYYYDDTDEEMYCDNLFEEEESYDQLSYHNSLQSCQQESSSIYDSNEEDEIEEGEISENKPTVESL
jgi:hypothetical protein